MIGLFFPRTWLNKLSTRKYRVDYKSYIVGRITTLAEVLKARPALSVECTGRNMVGHQLERKTPVFVRCVTCGR